MKKRKTSPYYQTRLDRRSERYAMYGRAQEQLVLAILSESELFDEVILHPANSEEDGSGKDFSVRIGDEIRSFGMTISTKSWNRSRLLYPNVPQFVFPLNVKKSTVINRIKELFNEQS